MGTDLANRRLRDLCALVLNPKAPPGDRAEAAEAAMARLAVKMLERNDDRTVFEEAQGGFLCNEKEYGSGDSGYLPNAQGLVGVLLPIAEVEWVQPSAAERKRILLAAETVVDQALKRDLSSALWFGLAPLVRDGPIKKALKLDKIAAFYSVSGVSWSLSALLLLYVCHVQGKIDLAAEGSTILETDLMSSIIATYGLLLDAYRNDGSRAGWGWCSLSKTPDLYHTWSASQTLGDLDDYVLQPEDSRWSAEPKISALRDALKKTAGSRKKGTIYREVSTWLYGELRGSDVPPAASELLGSGNASENSIYYSFLLVEALVYMRADESLGEDEKDRDDIRQEFYEKLLKAAGQLRKLRETPWYQNAEQSTLRVPLRPIPDAFKSKSDTIQEYFCEPCLEPLALRALSYGPIYLRRGEIHSYVEEALQRHVRVLDEKYDLWDNEKANFLICERTVEMFLMLRNLYAGARVEPSKAEVSTAPSVAGDAGSLSLVLPADQVDRVVSAVMERLRPDVRELVGAALAEWSTAAGNRSSTSVAIDLQVIDPTSYAPLLEEKHLRRILDGGLEPGPADWAHQTMLIETVIHIVVAALKGARPAAREKDGVPAANSPAEKLGEALAVALAAVLSRALRYHVQRAVDDMDDDARDGLKGSPRAVEDQVDRLTKKYAAMEFRAKEPYDLAGSLGTLLASMSRFGGGRAV